MRGPFEIGYSHAYSGLLYPAWQRVVRGRPVGKLLAILQWTQWLDARQLARTQLADLRALLVHAGAHVPYYREVFARTGFDPRALRCRDDLGALPVLTPHALRARHEELVSPLESSRESEAWRQAVRLRAYAWAGYRAGLPTLHYGAAGKTAPTSFAARKAMLDRFLRREVCVDCTRDDDVAMQRMADLLTHMQPHVVIGFTRALAGFSRWVTPRRARGWPDAVVVLGGEGPLPGERDAITHAFGPRVFETYGGRDTRLFAAECEAHEGLHVAEENVVVEILRDDGSPAPPGESGMVVVTDLHDLGRPLIRYANGARGTWGPPVPCRCGRSLRRLARVEN